MTFTTYLASTNQLTAWAVGTPSERDLIREGYVRQVNFEFNTPGYSFRMAGERHAEAHGISDEMVHNHIDLALKCRAGCGSYSMIGNEDGLCRTCAEEHEGLKNQPASWWDKLNRSTQYVLVGAGAVLIAVASAVIMAVVGGR